MDVHFASINYQCGEPPSLDNLLLKSHMNHGFSLPSVVGDLFPYFQTLGLAPFQIAVISIGTHHHRPLNLTRSRVYFQGPKDGTIS